MQELHFLQQQMAHLSKEQWTESYQSWIHGGDGWNKYQMGGTYINAALAWYQWLHKPGSKEWRPRIIMAAVAKAAKKE
jgi:hypothetical protein